MPGARHRSCGEIVSRMGPGRHFAKGSRLGKWAFHFEGEFRSSLKGGCVPFGAKRAFQFAKKPRSGLYQ